MNIKVTFVPTWKTKDTQPDISVNSFIPEFKRSENLFIHVNKKINEEIITPENWETNGKVLLAKSGISDTESFLSFLKDEIKIINSKFNSKSLVDAEITEVDENQTVNPYKIKLTGYTAGLYAWINLVDRCGTIKKVYIKFEKFRVDAKSPFNFLTHDGGIELVPNTAKMVIQPFNDSDLKELPRLFVEGLNKCNIENTKAFMRVIKDIANHDSTKDLNNTNTLYVYDTEKESFSREI